MKTLKEEIIFECSAKHLWGILSDVSRCDWVPTINEMTLEGDCRVFEMEGMGKVKEQILLLDNDTDEVAIFGNRNQNSNRPSL